ncbi:MAG: response regulator [Bacteroidia bacterium]|nr:response regulator [Bacteroidia bacterium]
MQKKERPQRSVLIIDDNVKDIERAKSELESLNLGLMIDVAKSGEEGILMLTRSETRLPDVILLDIQMPKMGAFEFLRIIRSYHSFLKIKVYLMNSLPDEYDKIRAKKLGVSGHLSKPIDLSNEGVSKDSSKNKLKKDLGV